MKRIFFALSLALCLAGFSSFAAEKISPSVLNSFFQTFKNAENVQWTEVDDMLRIGFTQNGSQRYAYYSNDELIVVATQIKSADLPKQLQSQLANYKNFSVSQVYTLEKNGRNEYCIILDNTSQHLVLKGKQKWQICIAERK